MTGIGAVANLAAILQAVIGTLCSALRPRASLVAENLVLRQQLAILRRATPRPRLRPIDRAFLGHGRPHVVAVGGMSRDRPAGDRDCLAPAGLRSVVGVEVSPRGSAAPGARGGEPY